MIPAALLVLASSVPAHASGPEEWAALHSGRLMAALDRDPMAAISVYEAVIEHLDADDPLRADYMFWLGRAWFEADHPEEATTALSAIDSRSSVSLTARALHGRIKLDQNRLQSLPLTIEPAPDGAPLVVGWSADAAPLKVVPSAGGGPTTLSWPLATDQLRAGFLAIGLDPDAGRLSGVRLEAQSSTVVLAARVIVETFDGQTYAGVPSVLRPGVWTDVEARVGQLRSRSPGNDPLDPRNVSMVAIEMAPVDPASVSSGGEILMRSIVLDGSPSNR
jgi:hypothetical protein